MTIPLDTTIIRQCFKEVIPWSKDIKQVIIKRFEIVGIPLQLWNDLTIHKIGSTLGEVKEIHDNSYTFDVAEVTVIVMLQKSVKLKSKQNSYYVWV